MVLDRVIPVIVVLAWPLVLAAEIHFQIFDGITIIDITEQDGQHIIKGQRSGSNPYLVTYVAANGIYAALCDGRECSCVAWGQNGSYIYR